MANGSGSAALKAFLELITGAVNAGSETRGALLASASQMASAIQMAAALSTSRLAGALAAQTTAEKRQILAKLTALVRLDLTGEMVPSLDWFI